MWFSEYEYDKGGWVVEVFSRCKQKIGRLLGQGQSDIAYRFQGDLHPDIRNKLLNNNNLIILKYIQPFLFVIPDNALLRHLNLSQFSNWKWGF